MNNAIHGIAPLSHWGVIRAEGEDAAKFLQGQLTQDFVLLGPQQARLAGFCTAKGRLQASFIGFKQSPTDILLVCSRDILAATLKRLSMFVMRAKVKLSDASEDFALFGLMGDPATALVANHPAWNRLESGQASIVVLYPAAGQTRALWVAPVGDPKPVASPISTELWQWSEVQSGIAMVTTPIVEAFVPQMLNYESVGGVNFKKGCYPGQEVVARSQFRGTLKRRGFLVHCDAPLLAGQEVFNSLDAEQPVGLVVQAAPSPEGGWDAMVSLQLSALPEGTLHSVCSTGSALKVLPLPYALLEDI
jgi:folate-binding protein YgfZ